jgi:hypothetical protein
MTNKRILLSLCVLALFPQYTSAYVNFDDFQVNLLDHRLHAGDNLQVLLRFKNPDRNRSADADIQILVNGVPVFRDEGYRIDFVEGQDRTVTITSNDFPGPDQEGEYYGQNLLKYACGEYAVVVRISGAEFRDDLEERDKFTLGGDDKPLELGITPAEPSGDDVVVVSAKDGHGKELKGVNVKVTWLDDPSGEEAGRWDSEDKRLSRQTNSAGEARVNLTQKFTKAACGLFQVDAYGDGYCLSREFFNVSVKPLVVSAAPESPAAGQAAAVCAKEPDGAPAAEASVRVAGQGFSKAYEAGEDGCVNLTLQKAGEYALSAEKGCWKSGETRLKVAGDSGPSQGGKPSGEEPQNRTSAVNETDAGGQEPSDQPSGGISGALPDGEGMGKVLLIVGLAVAIVLLLKK